MVQAIPVALACVLAIAASAALAQAYPNKPVRVIDAFPAGGAGDVIARIMAPRLTEVLGQPVVVENRPGAGGNIGAEFAARAAPDGYTMFMGVTSVLAPSRSLYPKLPYDALRDFAPVSRAGSGAYMLVAHPSLPVRSVKDLVALAKANPGQLKYASGGVGSGQHLAGEFFRSRTGTNLTHVAYKGGPPAVIAVTSGESEIGFVTVTSGLGQVNARRMRALAVTSPRRMAALPNVATVAESGYPGFEITPVFGFYAPVATSKDIVAQLNAAIRKVIDMSEIRERFAAQAVEPAASTPAELGAILASEIALWAKVIKAGGIRID